MTDIATRPRRGRPPKIPREHGDTREALLRCGMEVLTTQGMSATGIDAVEHALRLAELGAGEIGQGGAHVGDLDGGHAPVLGDDVVLVCRSGARAEQARAVPEPGLATGMLITFVLAGVAVQAILGGITVRTVIWDFAHEAIPSELVDAVEH